MSYGEERVEVVGKAGRDWQQLSPNRDITIYPLPQPVLLWDNVSKTAMT